MLTLNKKIEKDISFLNLSDDIYKNLINNNINNILELCEKTRKDLKKINLSSEDIKEISIKLQLCGLDLNKKNY